MKQLKTHFFLKIITIICLAISVNSAAQSFSYGNVAIGGGGFVSSIIMSKTQPNVMYARTDVGGAYRWESSTGTWIPLTDWVSDTETGFLGIESLALDPKDNNTIYMSAGISYFNNGKSAILKSTDAGKTFTVVDVSNQFKIHGNGMGRQNGEKLQVDPNNSNVLYCGTRWNGLFKSINAGASWSRMTSLNVTTTANENGISFVVLDPTSVSGGNTQRIFVGVSQTGTNFYMSTNGGTSFTAVSGAPTNYMPQRAVLAGNDLLITYANGAGPHGNGSGTEPVNAGQIWKYSISNGQWTNITPNLSSAYSGISVDPNNNNRLIASTINKYNLQFPNAYGDRLFLSNDGGNTWRDLVGNGINININGNTWITGKSIHWAGCIEFDPFNTEKAWVTSGNGIFSCDNINASTTTWKFNTLGLEETVPLDIVSIPGGPLVSVIGDYDGFKHTDITQYAPIHTPNMGTSTGITYASANVNKLVRVGNEMYYTTNQGTSWTKTSSMNGSKGKVALSVDGNILLHNPENSTTLYRSTNNGSSWSTVSGVNINNGVPVADPVNSNKFYMYSGEANGLFYVSTNGGSSFTSTVNVGTYGSKVIRTVPGREGHIWVACNYGGLKRSTNSGTSFTTVSGVSDCAAVGIGKASPGANYETIYIWGTVNGVRGMFYSINEGASWTRMNDNLHQWGGPGNGQFVIGDMNTFGIAYMSTAGRGIVYAKIESACSTPAMPSATSPISYCQGASATALVASGTSLKWYGTNSTGGSASANAPTPNTSTTGTITYYVTQTVNGCESNRKAIEVQVNASSTWYADTDNDGFGDPNVTQVSCSQPNGYVSNNSDACPTDINKTNPGKCGCGKTEESCVDCNGDLNGTAKLDNCGVCTGGNTGVKVCTSTIQGEDACVLDGTVDANNVGYTGAGFANTDNVLGSSVAYVINSPSAQNVSVSFRYANGSAAPRDGELIINGKIVSALSMSPTGAWTTWNITTVNVNLLAGLNNISVRSSSTDGLGNLDAIYFSDGVSNANCVVTALNSSFGNSEILVYPNPSSNKVFLNEIQTWYLLQLDGKELLSGEGKEIDIMHLSTGVYLLKVGDSMHRIIKN